MIKDNFELDPTISPCEGCRWAGTEKCNKCKHRKRKQTPYIHPIPYPFIPYKPYPRWKEPNWRYWCKGNNLTMVFE